jgi:hypothetical protein
MQVTGSDNMYCVIYRGEPIGSSKLEKRDRGMAVAFGDFEPLPAYDAVRHVFLLFIQAIPDSSRREQHTDEQKLAQYYQERDALQLTLQDADGHFIPTSWIHIVDFDDLGREVEAQISDRGFWGEPIART